jgi:tRNA nucleotidyltransferase/poly(A) polymerase
MINYSDEWTDSAIRRLIKRLGPLLERQLDLYEADIRALCDSDELLRAAYELRTRTENIDKREQVSEIKPPLDGKEICAILGIEPGPLVGEYKAKLLDAVLTGELSDDKEAAREYLRRLAVDFESGSRG